MKHYHLFFLISFLCCSGLCSQEIKHFKLEDFDLTGNVKKCQVITDYGQEIFEFDALGRLVRSTTQYNEQDRDVTTYTFDGEHLVEKRLESYKDKELDLASSMAHFYSIDSSGAKIISEQIISYDKEFVEAQEYQFDTEGRLSTIMVSHENAVDEIRVEYGVYKKEMTTTYFENGIVQKSIRSSTKKNSQFGDLTITLIKTYLDGEPNRAVETSRRKDGLLLSEEIFQFEISEKQFVSQERHTYEYDLEGVLQKEIIKRGNTLFEKEYIFQFDSNEQRNWVKKIISPENSYTTRKLEYYPKVVADVEIRD